MLCIRYKRGMLLKSNAQGLRSSVVCNRTRRIVSFALLVAAAVSAEAQFGIPLGRSDPKQDSETARDLVARYCRMDYAGARITPN